MIFMWMWFVWFDLNFTIFFLFVSRSLSQPIMSKKKNLTKQFYIRFISFSNLFHFFLVAYNVCCAFFFFRCSSCWKLIFFFDFTSSHLSKYSMTNTLSKGRFKLMCIRCFFGFIFFFLRQPIWFTEVKMLHSVTWIH